MTADPEFVIREAHSGGSDGPLLARTLQTAEPTFFAMALGSQATDVLTTLVEQPGHAWSLSRARIAQHNEEAQGAVIAGPADTPQPDLLSRLGWGSTRLRAMIVSLAWLPVGVFLGRHDPGEWYVNAIAVEASARGRGLGRALLRRTVTEARDAGRVSVALHVDGTNAGAISLYRSEGFEVVDTFAPSMMPGRVIVHRMRMRLA